jgi:hypothetical protein
MAGSAKYFKYTSDDGKTWAALRDESNVEAINAGVAGIITPAEKYKIPSNLKPRTAVYVDTTGRIRREIIVLTPAAFGALDATTPITDQVSGELLRLKFTKGERVTLPSLQDTALNDGDAD